MSCTKYWSGRDLDLLSIYKKATLSGAGDCWSHFSVSRPESRSSFFFPPLSQDCSLLETSLDTTDWYVYNRRGTKGALSLASRYYIPTTGSNLHTRASCAQTGVPLIHNGIKQTNNFTVPFATHKHNATAVLLQLTAVVLAWIQVCPWPLKNQHLVCGCKWW